MQELIDNEVFIEHIVSFSDSRSSQFIDQDMRQHLKFPKEYPAYIAIHTEDPPQDVPLHWHPASELIYSGNREIAVTIDGERQTVYPGEFILINSYALHSVIPSKLPGSQDVMSITFHTGYLERMMPGIQEMKVSRKAEGATVNAVQNMTALCKQLREQVGTRNGDPTKQFRTNQLLFEILQSMYSDFLTEEEYHGKNMMRDKIIEILVYLDNHYQEKLTTQMLADRFGYSREYFCRIFKQYSNQTFKQYLTEIRLDNAVTELLEKDTTVLDVAMDNGFPDEKSFFTAFRKRYGITPAQFRSDRGQRPEINAL